MPRLNGWKEIAGYLDKSVRTVQRWEHEYQLPVHRVGREGGEIIWADEDELTAWLHAGGAVAPGSKSTAGVVTEVTPPPVLPPEQPPKPPLSEEPPRAAATTRVHVPRWAWALGTVILATGAWGWSQSTGHLAVDWKVERGNLVGYNADGGVAWTRTFTPPLVDEGYAEQVGPLRSPFLIVDDLDRDGRREVIVHEYTGVNRSAGASFTVFDADGRVRFGPIVPKHSVQFGDRTYSAPWIPRHSWVTRAANGSARVHLSFVHQNEYPTLVMTFDDRGTLLGEYWSNGYVETLTTGQVHGQHGWILGGANNETDGGFVAMFTDVPKGTAPAADPEYRCVNCPEGGPVDMLVMPQLCVGPATYPEGQNVIVAAYTESDGTVYAHTFEGPFEVGKYGAQVIYSFTPRYEPIDVLVTGGLLQTHLNLFREGRLDHEWSDAEHFRLFPVLRWAGDRWEVLPKHRVAY
jgi:hypothetical protein